MTERAASAADATRLAVGLARALTLGMRNWGFYPPEHPAVAMAIERFIAAATESSAGGMMQLAVTPHALLFDGLPLVSTDLAAVECAELLHDRDILQLTFVAPPGDAVVRALLTGADARSRNAPRPRRPGRDLVRRRSDGDPRRADRLPGNSRARNRRRPGPPRRDVAVDRPLDHHGPVDVQRRRAAAPARYLPRRRRDRRALQRRQGAVPHAGRLADANDAGGHGSSPSTATSPRP